MLEALPRGHWSQPIEGGKQAGQPFGAGINPRLLIGVNGARRPFSSVVTGTISSRKRRNQSPAGLLLRTQRPSIRSSRLMYIHAPCFAVTPHAIVAEGIPQTISGPAVNQLAVAQLSAGAAIVENAALRSIFLTAGNLHHASFSAMDCLRRQMQRLQSGATHVVNRNGRNGIGQAAADRRD